MTPAADLAREGSRDRVLAVLRSAPKPLGVGALAAATGLSPNAVRFHLDHLVAAGAVRSAKDPAHAGPGRPSVLYSAAPAEAVDSAAAYRSLAGLLAAELTRSGRPDASSHAGRAWVGRMLDARPLAVSDSGAVGGDGVDPVAAIVTLFADTGFAPVVAADGHTIELHRCPFMELAVQQPEVVCSVHLGMVTGVLEEIGARTKARLVPVLDGTGPCVVRIAPTATTAPRPADPSSHPSIEEQVS